MEFCDTGGTFESGCEPVVALDRAGPCIVYTTPTQHAMLQPVSTYRVYITLACDAARVGRCGPLGGHCYCYCGRWEWRRDGRQDNDKWPETRINRNGSTDEESRWSEKGGEAGTGQ